MMELLDVTGDEVMKIKYKVDKNSTKAKTKLFSSEGQKNREGQVVTKAQFLSCILKTLTSLTADLVDSGKS